MGKEKWLLLQRCIQSLQCWWYQSHKDRLTRFGFNYIETLIEGEIVIANRSGSNKEDLMQDLISIITSMVQDVMVKGAAERKQKNSLVSYE